MIKKTLIPTNDMYMQFTEDELNELGMKPGDKFDIKHQEDGSIKLEKYVKMEIDFADWDRELLEIVVKRSCEDDVSVNEIINDTLKQYLNSTCGHEIVQREHNSKTLLLEKDYLYNSNIDPNFTNNDTSICTN